MNDFSKKFPGMVELELDGHSYTVDPVNTVLLSHEERPHRKTREETMKEAIDGGFWAKAEAASRELCAGLAENDPRRQLVTAEQYRALGGRFPAEFQKALGTVETVCRATPIFIADPAKWVRALEACGANAADPSGVDFGLVTKAYADMGGGLQPSELLVKAKYVEKVPKPGGGYRYKYPGKPGTGTGRPASGPAAPKAGSGRGAPPARAAAPNGIARSLDRLAKQDEHVARASLQNVSDADMHAMSQHAEPGSTVGKMLKQEAESRKVKAERDRRAGQEKPVDKSQAVDFETFSRIYREDVSKSLAEADPNLDLPTLESRVDGTLRQMYKQL